MEATLSSLKTTILAVILAMAIFLFTLTKWGSSLFSSTATTKWPAGPKTLPIIGNLHQLGGEVLHVALLKLAKIHGGVMTIWMGSRRPVIVVSDIKEAWEVLVSKSSDYSARDLPELVEITSAGLRTIGSSDSGPFWHNLRKGLQNGPLSPFSILAQINFQETDILRMIKDIREEAKIKGGIVKPLDHLKIATVRLLSRLIFGQTFDHDSFIESMHHEIDALIRVLGFGRLSDVFSFAKYLPNHRRNVKQHHQIKLSLQELIRPHLLALEPPSNSYLNFLISQDYQEDVIIACIAELYLLGVDSIASSTMWALAFLIHDQAAQEKLYQQIKPYATKSECGLIKTHDLSHLPYLQAVMKETMRMKPIAPLAIPHKACKDTSLKGTMVAKGTMVMVNIYALHHDHNIWTDPYKFMPERFLQGDGEATGQSFLPFGGGMRSCAGMELGKLQFSLALANLVNVFEWTSVVDGKLPDMTEELTVVILMKTTLESRIIPRNQ